MKNKQHSLKAKYHHLKQKIERTIKNGRFYRYTQRKQQQLLKRLARYQKRLIKAGQLAIPAAGLMLASPAFSEAQTFTKITTSASPFINFDVNPDAPFGLSSIGKNPRATFVDIDSDGDLDAFVGEYNGTIRYFENTSNSSTILAFALSSSSIPFGLIDVSYNSAPTFVDIDKDGDLDAFVGEYFGDVYYYENTSTNSSIPAFDAPITDGAFGLTSVGNLAVPSFVDIDKDGDLDLFVGSRSGDIYYFENTSTDSSIPAFTMPQSNDPFGLATVSEGAAPVFVDIDGDGVVEAFIGQGEGGGIQYYKNISTNSSVPVFSLISSENAFGLGDIGDFTKPNFVDIDGDGQLEAFIDEANGTISFYENTSTNTAVPAFLELTVDVKNHSTPTFIDIDKDGDLDIFVGETDGNINYFENTDTSIGKSVPAFVLSSSSEPFGLIDVGSFSTPTFVDIDGDGQLEAFVGESNDNLNYFENTSIDSTQPAFSLLSSVGAFNLLNVNQFSVPTFVDIDVDGDLDAIVGGRFGGIQYFENTGTPTSAAFTLSSSSEPFGLVSNGNFSIPTFVDIDLDGDLDAFVGVSNGKINYFENISTDSTMPQFVLSPNTMPFGLTDVGDNSAPAFADIDGDNLLEAVVGNRGGRLIYFESNARANAAITPLLTYCEQVNSNNPFSNTNISSDASPILVDVDGDGNLDLISGAGSGAVLYFQNDGSDGFIQQTGTNNPFDGVMVSGNSKPQLANVDGDASLDLIIGVGDGTIQYFQNQGSNGYVQQSGTNNPFIGTDVGFNAAPQLVNVDGDNDLDLIIGSALNGIFYLQNQGNNSFIQQNGTSNPFAVVTGVNDLAPQLIDVDGDGDLDLIVGNNTGTVRYYENDGSNNFTQQTGTSNPFNGFDVGAFSIPHLADVDGDTDLDLLVGDQSGNIAYYQNIELSVNASTAACTNNQGAVELTITSDLFGPYNISNAFTGSVGTADTLGANTTLATGITIPGTYTFEVSASNGCAQVATSVVINDDCIFKPNLDDNMTYTGSQVTEQCDFRIIRSTATVEAPFSLTYSATEAVILQVGFHAKSGSSFRARIGNCISPPILDIVVENRTEVTLDDFVDENSVLSIFPIPASTHLYYKMEQMEGIEAIYLFDMFGRLVREERVLDGQLDISDLPNGQYTLVLVGKERRVHRLVQKQ